MKRFFFFFVLIGAIAAGYYYARPPALKSPGAETFAKPAAENSRSDSPRVAETSSPELTELNLAGELNAPGKSIHDDLKLLDSVFSVWQTNFLHTGNPIGTNAEITAALAGKNALKVAFISPRSPAIDRAGELCDRWGTPFFFHQISGAKMEIRSAGPDKIRGTADDVTLTP